MSENTAENLEVEQEENVVPDIEVQVVDDTPQEDQGRPARTEGTKPNIPEDDEIAQYKGDAQKRIKQLKYEYHEERRAKEAAEREKNEAIAHAERVLKENNSLKKTLDDGEALLVEQVKGRTDAVIEAAKKEYKEAYEAGDPDKIVEAQSKLNKAQAEQFKVNDYKPRKRAEEPAPKKVEPAYTEVKQHQPTQEDKDWLANNDWFQKKGHEEMTGFAMGVHQKLLLDKINPVTDAQTYYQKIDEAMQRTFPDYFDKQSVETREVEAPPRSVGSVVAAPSRTAKKPRKVQLTSTQVALAKRLGLTNEQYAAQLLKEAN